MLYHIFCLESTLGKNPSFSLEILFPTLAPPIELPVPILGPPRTPLPDENAICGDIWSYSIAPGI